MTAEERLMKNTKEWERQLQIGRSNQCEKRRKEGDNHPEQSSHDNYNKKELKI